MLLSMRAAKGNPRLAAFRKHAQRKAVRAVALVLLLLFAYEALVSHPWPSPVSLSLEASPWTLPSKDHPHDGLRGLAACFGLLANSDLACWVTPADVRQQQAVQGGRTCAVWAPCLSSAVL